MALPAETEILRLMGEPFDGYVATFLSEETP
jgi:hypothetical protein